jgi:hypothetical protein
MPQDLIAPLFREIHVEKNEVEAGCVFISIRVVEKLCGRESVPHNADVGIDLGRFKCLTYEKHVRSIVLDHKNLAREFAQKINLGA